MRPFPLEGDFTIGAKPAKDDDGRVVLQVEIGPFTKPDDMRKVALWFQEIVQECFRNDPDLTEEVWHKTVQTEH